MQDLPYPRLDEDAQLMHQQERAARAVKMLDPGDVIAEVEDLVAQISEPTQHPLYGVVAYYLEAGGPDTGRLPWNLEALSAAYDRLVKDALSRLIEAKLADFGAWED